MKIKKNGKVINLTESDLKRIVKKVLKEQLELPRGSYPLPSDRTGPSGDFQPLKHLKGSTNKKKVLFVGDSQTNQDHSYANQLIDSGLLHKDSINASVWGEPTSKIINQLETSLKTHDKFNIISIMGGGNDGRRKSGDTTAQDNLKKMYNMAKSRGGGATVVAISNPTKIFVNNYKKVYPANDEIANWVNNQPISDITIDGNKISQDKDMFNSDKIHLNSLANTKIKNEFIKKVLNT